MAAKSVSRNHDIIDITQRIKLLLEGYIYQFQQSLSELIIVPKDILQLILDYFAPTNFHWISLKPFNYCAPPILINKRNEEEYILISLKGATYALSKYYEDNDYCVGHEERSSDKCGLDLTDHTIAVTDDQSLVYIIGGYKSQFGVYSLLKNDWLRVEGVQHLMNNDFGLSWYSPSVCINNDFHWISTQNQIHYIWNHEQNEWHNAYEFGKFKLDATTMIYIEKLNKFMMIAATSRHANKSSVKDGSIWFSSTVQENKVRYSWTQAKDLLLPFNRKLFGCIYCSEYDLLFIFGGLDIDRRKKTDNHMDDIWCLKMSGRNVKNWEWKQLSFKCPSKSWYHAVRTRKNNNVHLFNSYDGSSHWMINLETIICYATFT